MKWHPINSIVGTKCGKILWYTVLIQLISIIPPFLCQEEELQQEELTDEDLKRQGNLMGFKI